jgi:hypothetical protein
METTITGVIKSIGQEINKSSHFNTREFILTTEPTEQYPQHLPIQLVNANCDKIIGFKPGDKVEVDVKIKGREWNGPQGIKYFLTLEAWSINKIP